MKYPQFSVSLCVYEKDEPQWFDLAVESILNQTVPPSEVVLVVDGPVPPKLDQCIQKYEKNDIFQVIRFAENRGHGIARRAGLEACTKELVALMDADDISEADRFRQQLQIFQTQNVDIVGGDIAEFIGEPENTVAYRKVPMRDVDIKHYMRERCPFNQMTVMFKKSAVQKSGGYLDWYCNEDYYLWLRMSLCGCTMMNTGTVLVFARVGPEMYSRRGGLRYFQSEARLQSYMLQNRIIGLGTYCLNIAKRIIVQLLLPSRVRGWVFRKFARNKN